jgi:hypothetical protein
MLRTPSKNKIYQILGATYICLIATTAQAGEGMFGYVYSLDTQPKGKLEFEQRFDVTHGQAVGSYNLGQYRSELEYGLTDDIQIAGYLNAYSVQAHNNYTNPEMCENKIPCTAGFGVPSSAHDKGSYNKFEVDGVSLEMVWRILNPVTSPVGVGLYVEPTLGRFEDSLEWRLLLQSNYLDDRLIFALNFLYEPEKEKYDSEVIRNSMGDILYGVSYRFAPNWSGGIEGRFHTDHDGYYFDKHIQTANFIGPTLHYADKDWWATATWRYQIDGKCYNDGTADCQPGYNLVADNHGRNQFMLKVGFPFN